MPYHFRNFVFDGGGVKGIAYVGAMQVLEQKGILPDIKRVGGTSAGAINALLFALGYSNTEQLNILKNLNFKNFMDDDWGVIRDTNRLIHEFGWYKGDFFHNWVSQQIGNKLGNPNATFNDLRKAKLPDLYVYGTNLSTSFGEIFSIEHTPNERIADAVRISMSIPLFFAAVRNPRNDVYVDGGVLDNYPVKLFDRAKYIATADLQTMGMTPDYYAKENQQFLQTHPDSSPYVFNRQTLGFRLDNKEEIAIFRDGKEPPHADISDFFDYIKALMTTILESQASQHLHGDDWHRTIYIDTLDVRTTDFDIADAKKDALLESGKQHALDYFTWFDDPKNSPVNRPA